MPSLPDPVIAALDAFAAPDARSVVDLDDVSTSDLMDAFAGLTMDARWVDMGQAHPVTSDAEGVRRMLEKLGAEGRCSVLSAHGVDADRDLGGALDGVLQQDGGALVACRPGPLAFLVTARGERWLLSRTELPPLTQPIPVVRA